MKKIITEKIAYILAAWVLAGITALFNMHSDIDAHEIEIRSLKVDNEKMATNILAIRCAVLKEKITCMEFEARK